MDKCLVGRTSALALWDGFCFLDATQSTFTIGFFIAFQCNGDLCSGFLGI
jgi:hypothetical protein